MIDEFPEWVKWVFSGIGIALITFVYKFFKNILHKPNQDSTISTPNNSAHSFNHQVNITLNTKQDDVVPTRQHDIEKLPLQRDLDELKKLTHILFIDDDRKFRIVNILKNDGWVNTVSKKDIKSLTAQEVMVADILFIDINGVGTALSKEQGLGIAGELKRRYPNKKIVIYSAEGQHSIFSENWKVVDDWLPKQADPIVYIKKVESLASEIYNEKANQK